MFCPRSWRRWWGWRGWPPCPPACLTWSPCTRSWPGWGDTRRCSAALPGLKPEIDWVVRRLLITSSISEIILWNHNGSLKWRVRSVIQQTERSIAGRTSLWHSLFLLILLISRVIVNLFVHWHLADNKPGLILFYVITINNVLAPLIYWVMKGPLRDCWALLPL